MTKQDDWFCNARWDSDEQQAYFARLAQARSKKAYVLLVKASYLWRSRDVSLAKEAIKLLELAVTDFPEDSRVTSCLCDAGQCQEFLGDINAAIDSYRNAILREKNPGASQTKAWSHLSLLVVRRRRADLYDEVVRLTEGQTLYLADQHFVAHAVRAVIAVRRNKPTEAKAEAVSALDIAGIHDSGLSGRAQLGLVEPGAYEDIVEELRDILEA